MKMIFSFFCILSLVKSESLKAQTNNFDDSLQHLTDNLVQQLKIDSGYYKRKFAILNLSDLNGEESDIGKYIAEEIFGDFPPDFRLVNRNQLNTLIKENQLKAEGFISPSTFKRLKQLSDVDLVVTGKVTMLSQSIKITLIVLNENGDRIANTKGEVPINADVRELLGMNTGANNRGFHRSLNSNEEPNNPQTVSGECEQNSTGDYCFFNSTSHKVVIQFGDAQYANSVLGSTITIEPNQTQCLYDQKTGVHRYNIYESGDYRIASTGQVRVDKCKSFTYEIK